MKAINYQYRYLSSDLTEDEYIKEHFGILLHDEDQSEPYETEAARLYKKGNRYNLLFANGCSCWEGEWDGWSMTLNELKKWSKKEAKRESSYRESAEKLLAKWIENNL